MIRIGLICLTLFPLSWIAAAEPDDAVATGRTVGWDRICLDQRFRSEGVSCADFTGDGVPDVAAGDILYVAPSKTDELLKPDQWSQANIREPGEFVAGKGYSNSFANFAWDVDRDGWVDQVIVGFPGDPFHWYRNPGNTNDLWQQHVIWKSACNESPEFEDLNGDGVPEFILGSQPEAQMGFAVVGPGQSDAKLPGFIAISAPSEQPADFNRRGEDNGSFKYSHGLGVGDVNGDGHPDVIFPGGWWQSPGRSKVIDTTAPTKSWTFHPIEVESTTRSDGSSGNSLPAASNIYTDDFDGDGDSDLFLSSAHSYGVWWAENRGDQSWKLHEIDRSYSQTHAVERADINGDGQLDYVTGKRFFAHNGRDPGGNDEVVMYWYEVKRGNNSPPQFIPHEIIAGKDTGIGTQFVIADVNRDRRPDIVLSNKKGVNVLIQK